MWSCTRCGRIFQKTKQPHSCKTVPLKEHFKNKDYARELFDVLVEKTYKIGNCNIISLPCCIHLFGKYDFLAILPKKDGLEIRFTLTRKVEGARLKQAVSLSKSTYKNCVEITNKQAIDKELMGWLTESYFLKGA